MELRRGVERRIKDSTGGKGRDRKERRRVEERKSEQMRGEEMRRDEKRGSIRILERGDQNPNLKYVIDSQGEIGSRYSYKKIENNK